MRTRAGLRIPLTALLAGCATTPDLPKSFLAPDRIGAIKKIALVQFDVDPGEVGGAGQNIQIRQAVAEADADILRTLLSRRFQLAPSRSMIRGAYLEGTAPPPGHLTPVDMRFFSLGLRQVASAAIPPAMARRLCEDLGVDAVVVSYARWDVLERVVTFSAWAQTTVVLNMYDRSGARVWGDGGFGQSEGGMINTFGPGGFGPQGKSEYAIRLFKEAFRKAAQQAVARMIVGAEG